MWTRTSRIDPGEWLRAGVKCPSWFELGSVNPRLPSGPRVRSVGLGTVDGSRGQAFDIRL
jgi:hypothetical protein